MLSIPFYVICQLSFARGFSIIINTVPDITHLKKVKVESSPLMDHNNGLGVWQ